MARLRFFHLLVFLAALLAGCTSVGFHTKMALRQLDFGPPDTVALCLYLDDGISEERARALVEEAWRDDAPLYGLSVTVPMVRRWPRPAFTMDGIMDALRQEPLTPPCDRIMALIGRHAGDYVWGLLLLPEVLGAVNDESSTHSYAVVEWASLNQLLSPPGATVRHELYHLLGCDEHFNMPRCYEQIAELKHWRRAHQAEFFPAWDAITKRVLGSREAVNARLMSLNSRVANSKPDELRSSMPRDSATAR